jgi:glc operon protein GlcG
MLKYEQAREIIEAAHVRAAHLNLRVSVAVVDAGAHLIALGRMDGAIPISPQIAEAKAVSAAMFQRDGGSLLQTATERPAFFTAVSGLTRTKLVPGQGSVLLERDGVVVGAIGVSGAKPEQDLVCAEAGAASFS